MIVAEEMTFHGCLVRVFIPEGVSESHPYPWRFKVQSPKTGRWHSFAGIPNQCETKHSALMRAYYRAKWMADGTFERRYR